MHDDLDVEITQRVACLERGSVIAAAGCGKTEQIALATQMAEGRRLILTHTHAGVDALRLRLKKHKVQKDKFRIDTIAGWCLWYSTSYPKRSGLSCYNPRTSKDWNCVYEATTKLIQSGAVNGVLTSSYYGVFVDEYQDCTRLQHQVIKAIAVYLPVCVFGDPLQAIFDFKGQNPVDWEADVFPVFKKVGELTRPWRWQNAGNIELANWLADVRRTIEEGGAIDLRSRPGCVSWEHLPDDPRFRQAKIIGTCKSVMGNVSDGRLVVIGDAANINVRAALAQKLAAVGFSNIEPIDCKNLYEYAKKIEVATGLPRLERALDFICACMTGTEKTDFLDSVKSRQCGGKHGTAKFGDIITTGVAVAEGTAEEALVDLLLGFHSRRSTRLFRREMFFAMRSGLQIKSRRKHDTLMDAIWEVQNRIRHAGRAIGKRSIGSTLLVKGLEFDHAVIVHADNMTRKDWYVALTRATTSVTIISPSECLIPAEQRMAKADRP
jgi:DNA helicase-2/ATP-dependent DNA helicase PcrA